MPLRVVIVSNVPPVVQQLVPFLRAEGHEPLAVLSSRRPADAPPPPPGAERMSDGSAPVGIDVLLAKDKRSVEPLLAAYRPDVMLCWGFAWKIPQAALDVPRLGSANMHTAPLPRWRGPVPLAWTIRAGDPDWGLTWHRMDAELDTGPILAQVRMPVEESDTTIFDLGPRLLPPAFGMLPDVLAKLVAGDPGEPQDESLATWAGHFEDDDYAVVDWTQPARAIHDQVRAWHLTFNLSGIPAPRAELDGERVRLVRTSLTDPGGGARRVECGDGPIWIVESEPLA